MNQQMTAEMIEDVNRVSNRLKPVLIQLFGHEKALVMGVALSYEVVRTIASGVETIDAGHEFINALAGLMHAQLDEFGLGPHP